jgi:hypothetical protein
MRCRVNIMRCRVNIIINKHHAAAFGMGSGREGELGAPMCAEGGGGAPVQLIEVVHTVDICKCRDLLGQ